MSRVYSTTFIEHIERCEYCQQIEEKERDKIIIFERQDDHFRDEGNEG